MSHFGILVILEKCNPEFVEGAVEHLLAPYSEELNVEEYEVECYCVGDRVRLECKTAATTQLGSMEKIRYEFYKRHPGADPFAGDIQEAWEDEVAGPIRKVEQELYDRHPEKGKADPKCDDCNGTGKRKTTFNPDSKWDWHQIGGRWTGILVPDYHPETDPKNHQKCVVCGGKGKFRRKECHNCKGTGFALAWPTEWAKFKGDILPVEKVPEKTCLFALVEPDGTWHEKGEMGWFGMHKPVDRDWKKTFRKFVEKYQDGRHLAVVVDCHV